MRVEHACCLSQAYKEPLTLAVKGAVAPIRTAPDVITSAVAKSETAPDVITSAVAKK